MQEPQWATEIIKEICAEFNRTIPQVTWRKRKGTHTTGSMHRRRDGKSARIVITLGTDSSDHKRVLLHELAHYLNTDGRPHAEGFYVILRRLFIKYGCLDEYRQKESRYRSSSMLGR